MKGVCWCFRFGDMGGEGGVGGREKGGEGKREISEGDGMMLLERDLVLGIVEGLSR